MADLLLKLVARARQEKRVDVIGFLREQARLLGGDIELSTTEPPRRFELTAKERLYSMREASSLYRVAASSEESEKRVVLLDTQDEVVGPLIYNYGDATLELKFDKQLPLRKADVEVHFRDGGVFEEKGVYVTERTTLLTDCSYTEDQVSEVILVAADEGAQ